jgi:ubiquinone biosynthesis protein COQ9
MNQSLDQIRRVVLGRALPAVPFDGWTQKTLEGAAVAAGLDTAELRRAFPGGAADLVDFCFAEFDRQMAEKLAEADLQSLPVRERIAFAVRTRLEIMAPWREAVRAALALRAHPRFGRRAPRNIYRTVDAIWRAVGDRSTDFNFYTKRALLAGVHVATVLYWLNDDSDGFTDTWAFLDRRIGDVMRIQKGRGRVEKIAAKLPSPWPLLGRLRYGAR